MIDNEVPPSDQVPFHSPQIISGALIAGVVVFACVAFVMGQGKQNEKPLMAYIGAAFTVADLLVFFIAPIVIEKTRLPMIRESRGSEQVQMLFQLFLQKLIICSALLQGVAFVNGAAYIIAGRWWSMALMIALGGGVALLFPTRTRFDNWVRTKREMFELESNESFQ